MEYTVIFSLDTKDGLTNDALNANRVYIENWFKKVSDVVANSEDDIFSEVAPFKMKLVSVTRKKLK